MVFSLIGPVIFVDIIRHILKVPLILVSVLFIILYDLRRVVSSLMTEPVICRRLGSIPDYGIMFFFL